MELFKEFKNDWQQVRFFLVIEDGVSYFTVDRSEYQLVGDTYKWCIEEIKEFTGAGAYEKSSTYFDFLVREVKHSTPKVKAKTESEAGFGKRFLELLRVW